MPDLSSLDTAKNQILSILLLCLVLVVWQASPVLFKISRVHPAVCIRRR